MGLPAVEDLLRATASTRDIGELVGSNPALISGMTGKLRTEEEDSVVATLFGVPVGFQFATKAGMTGIPAIVGDILTDPTTYLLGGIGTLTKAGRAARGSGRFLKAIDDIANLPNVTAKQKAKIWQALGNVADGVDSQQFKNLGHMADVADDFGRSAVDNRHALLEKLNSLIKKSKKVDEFAKGKSSTAGEVGAARRELFEAMGIKGAEGELASLAIPTTQNLEAFRHAVTTGGMEGGRAFVTANVAKRAKLAETLKDAAAKGDWKALDKAAKEVRKLHPTIRNQILFSHKRRKDLEQLFAQGSSARLAPTLAQQSEAGQRSLLKFSVPFTDIEAAIHLPGERAVMGALDKAVAKAPTLNPRLERGKGLVAGARIAAKDMVGVSQELLVTTEGLSQLGDMSVSSIMGVGEKAADFKGAHKTWIGEWLFGKDVAMNFGRHLEQLVPDKARREIIGDVMQRPDEYLVRSPTAGRAVEVPIFDRGGNRVGGRIDRVERTPFGDSVIFGDIKPGVDLKPEELEVAQALNAAFYQTGQVMLDQGLIENAVKHYLPRMVKKVNDKDAFSKVFRRAQSPKVVSDFYKSGLNRQIPFYDDLLKLEAEGKIVLEKDPAKLIPTYFNEVSKAAANQRFIENLMRVPWQVGDDIAKGHPMIMKNNKETRKLLEDLPEDTYRLDESMSEINLFTRRNPRAGGFSRPFEGGAYIHKDAIKKIRGLFAEGLAPADPGKVFHRAGGTFAENAARLAMTLNGFAKRSLLMASVFHHMALTESMSAAVGWPFLRGALNPATMAKVAASPFIEVARGLGMPLEPSFFAKKLREVQMAYPGMDIMEIAAKGGLQTGEILDAERDVIARSFKGAADGLARMRVPLGAPWVANKLADGIMAWDRGLWDLMHSGYKTFAFNELYHQGLAKFPGLPPEQIARDVAQHVNNSFGGQVWERFFIGRRGQQLMRSFIMAPDWTFSNLAVAWDVLGNIAMRSSTAVADLGGFATDSRLGRALRFDKAVIQSSDVRAAFARQYALRVGFINAAMAQMANKALSGHWMDENPEGFRTKIALGYKDSDTGRNVYLRVGKQFNEPFELMHDPQRVLMFKKSPLLTGAVSMFMDQDIFGNRISATEDGPIHRLAKDFGATLKNFAPIGASRAFQDGGSPLEAIGVPLTREFSQRGAGSTSSLRLSLPSMTNQFRDQVRRSSFSIPSGF